MSAVFSVLPFGIPLREAYVWGHGSHVRTQGVLVQCSCHATGASGWAEIAYEPGKQGEASQWAALAQAFADAWSPTEWDLETELYRAQIVASATLDCRIRCGVVQAWLACLAQRRQCRVGQLFDSINAADSIAVNGLVGCVDDAALLQRCGELVAQGVGTLKLKGSGDLHSDLHRCEIVKVAYPQLRLRLDPNGCWDRAEIVRQVSRIKSLDLEYVEEPVPFDLQLYQFLIEKLELPVAIDHWGTSADELELILDRLQPSAVIVKSPVVGGFDRALRVLQLAEQRGIQPVVTCCLETIVGIRFAIELAALVRQPTAHGVALWNWSGFEILSYPKINAGRIPVTLSDLTPRLDMFRAFPVDGIFWFDC